MPSIVEYPSLFHRAYAPAIIKVQGSNTDDKKASLSIVEYKTDENGNELPGTVYYNLNIDLIKTESGIPYAHVDIQPYVCSLFKHGEQSVRYKLNCGADSIGPVTAMLSAAQLGDKTSVDELNGKILTDFKVLYGYDGYPLDVGILNNGEYSYFEEDEEEDFTNIPYGFVTRRLIPTITYDIYGREHVDWSCKGDSLFIRPTIDNVRWRNYMCQLESLGEDIFNVSASINLDVAHTLKNLTTGASVTEIDTCCISSTFGAGNTAQLTTLVNNPTQRAIISGYYINGYWRQSWAMLPNQKAYTYTFVVTEDTHIDIEFTTLLWWESFVCQLDENGNNTGYSIATRLHLGSNNSYSILDSFPLAGSNVMAPAITELRYRELSEAQRLERENSFIDSVDYYMSPSPIARDLFANGCRAYDTTSCPLPIPDYILVNGEVQTSIHFGVNGGTQTVEVDSSQPWLLNLSPYAWVKAWPTSGGAGKRDVTITVEENESSYEGSYVLTFKHNTATPKSAVLNVNQDRSDVIYIDLRIDPNYNGDNRTRVSAWIPPWAAEFGCQLTVGGMIRWRVPSHQGEGEPRGAQFSVRIGNNPYNNPEYGETFLGTRIDENASNIEIELDKAPDSCNGHEVIVNV